MVLNTLKKVEIDDLDFEEDQGHLKNNVFSLVETYSKCDIRANQADNSIHLSIKGAQAEIESKNWR